MSDQPGNGTVLTTVSTRDRIRAKIFETKQVGRKEITFMGAQVEIRQPRLKDIVAAQEAGGGQNAIIQALINYTYVPGTDDKLFDEADAEGLQELPFGKDFIAVSKAIEELSEVNFLERKPASEETPPASM